MFRRDVFVWAFNCAYFRSKYSCAWILRWLQTWSLPSCFTLTRRFVFTYSLSLAVSKNTLYFINNSAQEGLISGSFSRQSSTNYLNSLLHFSYLLSLGGGLFKTFTITFIAGKSCYGTFPSASSKAVIPNDQMSALKL